MDEVFARRDMIAPARLKALSVKSDLRGAVRLGGHVAALAVTGAALFGSPGGAGSPFPSSSPMAS